MTRHHTTNGARVTAAALVLALLAGLGALTGAPAGAADPMPGFDGACEGELLELHNEARADAGLPALREDQRFNQVTRAWAIELSRSRQLRHNPSYVSQIAKVVTDWERMGENVGYGPDAAALHTAYMNSPGHRANILNGQFQRIAVGCFRDVNGRAWTAVNFVRARSTVPNRSYAPFMSSGETVGQLRRWLMGPMPPSSGVVEAETDELLMGRTTVDGYASDLVTSPAFTRSVPPTTRLYYAVFLRHPDAAGLGYWFGQSQTGLTLQRMADKFVASREFQSRYGSLTDPEYVDRVYTNILGRPADQAGRDFWTQKMREGWTRGRVLIGFSESAEYKRKTDVDVTISWAAIGLLGRPATEQERAEWAPQLERGQSDRDFVLFLLRSPAVADRAAHGG